MENITTAILLGAGQRGADVYGSFALEFPSELRFVAVADINEVRRREFQQQHNIPDDMAFSTWEDLLKKEKLADAAFICTQDSMHYKPTKAAIKKGYHILLEKPMSNDAKECVRMGELSQKHQRILSVCHVLRYTPFFSKLKEIINSDKIGNVVSLQQIENVAYWHQAHSFVRGNWNNSKVSSPMILSKACHDMDIILWLVGSDCKKISSFGNLMHFKSQNAPGGAPERCLDGCIHKNDCAYYAPDLYIKSDSWESKVLRKVVNIDTSDESLMEALRTGPYGRCVYHCDNDVVDHQVVNMEFKSGATASFTMCAFTCDTGRTLKIMGTKGQISADLTSSEIVVQTFLNNTRETINLNVSDSGHSGGDFAIVRDFLNQLKIGSVDSGITSAKISVQSHLMSLAAEKSRLENTVIDLDIFKMETENL